ncbi:hypothetical protein ABK040_000986 [Willaertia magna]
MSLEQQVNTSSNNNNETLNEENNKTELKLNDFECPLCLHLLCEPVNLHCGHSFCKFCIERSLAHNTSCPCCRANLGSISLKQIRPSIHLKQFLINFFPKEYNERLKEIKEEQEILEKTQLIKKKFFIGNLHSLVSREEEGDSNIHKWTFFVRGEDQNDDLEEFIDHIKVDLHPTFRPPTIILRNQPYVVTRLGWGYFTIRIKIYFKQQWHKPPFDYSHTLSFDGNGDMNEVELEFSKVVNENNNNSGQEDNTSENNINGNNTTSGGQGLRELLMDLMVDDDDDDDDYHTEEEEEN